MYLICADVVKMSVFKSDDSRVAVLETKVLRLEKQVRELCKLVGKPLKEIEVDEDEEYCTIS